MAKGTVGNLLVTMRAELGQLSTDVKEIENAMTMNNLFAGFPPLIQQFSQPFKLNDLLISAHFNKASF